MEALTWTTQKRKVNDLVPYELNPRKISSSQRQSLKESLEKFGLVEIPAINSDNTIIAGHQRLAILKLIGGQGRFKAYLSVTCYSYVVPALYTLLLIPVSFVTGSLHQDIPLSSLATLASTDMRGTFLFGILKGLDIFAIWYYAVMAIGFTAVSKLKKTYVYGVAAVIFLIGLIIAGVGETSMKAFM